MASQNHTPPCDFTHFCDFTPQPTKTHPTDESHAPDDPYAPRTYDTHVNISVDSSHHLYGVVPVTRRAIRAARAMMPRTAHTWSPGTLAHNSVSRISGRGLVALERYTSAISKSCSPPAHPVISRLGRRYLRLRTPHGGRVLMPRAQPLHPHGTAERLDTWRRFVGRRGVGRAREGARSRRSKSSQVERYTEREEVKSDGSHTH
jgi:hypothetical protein